MEYRGSCHCGRIGFAVEGELAQAMECNCSICTKRGSLLWFVPRASLQLKTPAANLSTYTFNKHQIKHHFCSACGCAPFRRRAELLQVHVADAFMLQRRRELTLGEAGPARGRNGTRVDQQCDFCTLELIKHRSRFGLLVGPAGSGKSLVLGEFARRQRAAGAAVALVDAAGQSATELLAEITAAWGCNPSAIETPAALWRAATDRLAELRLEQVPTVVALDDLDRASRDALTVVERLLQVTDVEFTVVAAAGETTVARLGSRLVDQVELRIELALWTTEDTRDYLQASLQAAGLERPSFAERAVERLFQLTGGAPRRVSHLAQLALIAGAGQNLTQIDEQTVLAVHDELSAAR